MDFAHAAELPIKILMRDATLGQAEMSEAIIDNVASDVSAGLNKQFNGGPRDAFRLRMSNIGRAKCQLWFEKNMPAFKEPMPEQFMMNMMLGDIVEAVFKGILRTAGVEFQDNEYVSLDLGGGRRPIKGEYDLVMAGRVDDVKSASDYSYTKKFVDLETLQASDPFGYVAQLAGYAKASNKKAGGWWVVNKANGQFKYVEAEGLDVDQTLLEVDEKLKRLNQNEFARDFEPVEETFRSKPTGNKVLSVSCKFCNFKADCWPTLKTLPSIPSSARNPADVDYVYIAEG